ncbi:hypothetical protein [Erysipelothrix anatis]|uniref:hypothetical protein n=1 Tax=Erysipelothrix anatis TaxID=2683713 RepID=UPI0013571425|nr:hypothetical protein [Erysipelothrix anatis]
MTFITILMAAASIVFAVLGINQIYSGEILLSFISILGSIICLFNIYLIMTTDSEPIKKRNTSQKGEYLNSRINEYKDNNGTTLNDQILEPLYESGRSTNVKNTTKSNILFISSSIGLIYFLYLITYILTSMFTISGDSFYDLGTAIGVTLLIPHAIAVLSALIFSFVGWYFNKKWAALTSGILYIVSILFMPLYFLFVVVQAVLSFVGAFKVDSRNLNSDPEILNHRKNSIANNKIVKVVFGIVLITAPILVGIQAANSNKQNIAPITDTPDKSKTTTSYNKPVVQEENEQEKSYGIGEPIIISEKGKDLYSFTVNSIKTTDERNQFSEKEVEQVIVINYSYENIANPEDVYIFSSHFSVIDESGNVSETYPAGSNVFPQKAPIGAKSHGEESFGLLSSSSKVTMYFKPEMFGDLKIKLELPVE